MARPRQRNRLRRNEGFTLLELLVALALLATLTVILLNALQFGAQVWHRSEPAAATVELASAYRTLQNNIERALPIPERMEQTNATFMAFEGTATSVTLVVANPGRVGLLGDTVLHLALQNSDGSSFLGVSWAPYDTKRRLAIDAFNETLTLLPDVSTVSFRYFGMRDGEAEPVRWSSDWQNQTRLPRLVGIDLEWADGRRRSWSFCLKNGG